MDAKHKRVALKSKMEKLLIGECKCKEMLDSIAPSGYKCFILDESLDIENFYGKQVVVLVDPLNERAELEGTKEEIKRVASDCRYVPLNEVVKAAMVTYNSSSSHMVIFARNKARLNLEAQIEQAADSRLYPNLKRFGEASSKLPPPIEQEIILEPWLRAETFGMIYGETGCGKSHLALEIARSVASGTPGLAGIFYPYEGRKVCVLDGEMPKDVVLARLEQYGGVHENLVIISKRELGAKKVDLNLANSEHREDIRKYLVENNVGLLVIDNLTSLCIVGSVSDDGDWAPINAWCLSLISHGIAVILVHHSGKNKDQLGTSTRTNNMDWIWRLENKQANLNCGHRMAKFSIKVEKNRYGGEIPASVISVTEGKWEVDGSPDDLSPLEVELLRAIHDQESFCSFAKRHSIGHSTPDRMAKKLKYKKLAVRTENKQYRWELTSKGKTEISEERELHY